MIGLNDKIKEYMKKYNRSNIVLCADEITS